MLDIHTSSCFYVFRLKSKKDFIPNLRVSKWRLIRFISLQWEDQPSAAGHSSVLLVDEKGTVFRWTPTQNSLQADYQHIDLPDTEVLLSHAVVFTRNASVMTSVCRDGTLHITHFRTAAEGPNPNNGFRHSFS
jgi:WD40 repeat protein